MGEPSQTGVAIKIACGRGANGRNVPRAAVAASASGRWLSSAPAPVMVGLAPRRVLAAHRILAVPSRVPVITSKAIRICHKTGPAEDGEDGRRRAQPMSKATAAAVAAVQSTARATQPTRATRAGGGVVCPIVMKSLLVVAGAVAVIAVMVAVTATVMLPLNTATVTMTMGQHRRRRKKQQTASLRGASGRRAVAVAAAGVGTAHQS